MSGEQDGKQVSEVSGLGEAKEAEAPIAPGDSTAGYPESESGAAQEGNPGPNAAPRHDPPSTGDQATDPDDNAKNI